MSISISSTNSAHVNAVENVQSAAPRQASSAAAPSTGNSARVQAPANDSVQISNLAKAALKEATETPAQTAQEAAGGDAQARRLLAKEAANKVG